MLQLLKRECLAWIEECAIHLPHSPLGSRLRSRYWAWRLRVPGNDISVMAGTRFYSVKDIRVGSGCSINTGVIVDPSWSSIAIGNDVLIGANTVLRAANHRFEDPHVPIKRQGHYGGPIVIEDDVWLGAQVVILPGVTVGHGSVVAAGSVVTRSCPPFSILAGIPARVIKRRGQANDS